MCVEGEQSVSMCVKGERSVWMCVKGERSVWMLSRVNGVCGCCRG